jgi:predicted DNA-binding protein
MNPSKRFKPFMTYITDVDHARLRRLSKKTKKSMAHHVREAVTIGLSQDNPYTSGFNDGVAKAISVVSEMQVAQMRFPSGKSFAELIKEELETHQMTEVEDGADRTA